MLTKNELVEKLQHEVRTLLHLISKVAPSMLAYRPTPKQRNLLELWQYLTIFGSIHLLTIKVAESAVCQNLLSVDGKLGSNSYLRPRGARPAVTFISCTGLSAPNREPA